MKNKTQKPEADQPSLQGWKVPSVPTHTGAQRHDSNPNLQPNINYNGQGVMGSVKKSTQNTA